MDSTLLRRPPSEPPAPSAASLPVGTVIAGRFTVEELAGRGGMGTVYRATDALSGQPVALKLLRSFSSPDAPRRFTREAEVLSSLRHPGIVAYVAHGQHGPEHPFLAMEWLEGETLAQRLADEPLRLEETLALLRHAARALAFAHQQGVIHRDLKPSNLLLRQGRPEDVVLLDFGLARNMQPSSFVTASQTMLGTPGYMAPEQVSGQSSPTPRTDIFSLGCVLYECLTGQPPFSAPHLVATLAKILFTEPAPLRELRPELPVALLELVERMLAREPAHRHSDATHLLGALEELGASLDTDTGTASAPDVLPPRLAAAGQQLVTVLLAAPRLNTGHFPVEQDSRQALRDSLRTLLAPRGARVELLADGALVLTLAASLGSATDPASLAARCALSLLERWPEAVVVLTTGRGSLDSHLPVGEAMDRAGQLLRQAEPLPTPSAPVLLDEVTAGLLGPGFQLSRSPSGGFLLHGEQPGTDESRPLLGKPTPCVGREHELAVLEIAFAACVEEPGAQAVLVTAPAGTGKSRLRHEFLRRLEHHAPAPLVLLGRGDPMSAGSADGLLAQALRRLCGIRGGEPLEERRAKLSQRLSQHLPEARAREVVEFLGELCASPFPDEHSPRLHAARGDPQMMSLQMGRALVGFLEAECAHHPVLLVLEDLHWGDPLSVRLMDEALRELAEHPFLVLALARPEVEQLLPGPWAQRMQPMPLRGLSRKAGARLVREMLGADAPGALVDRLVEQSAGNALFLEELIRSVVEGRGETPPETVLAMLQARLARLEPEARQVLWAASFLGRTFWRGGVRALLDGGMTAEALKSWLQHLVEREWVEPQRASRFPGEEEYRFRHALVRDAAYGLVPDGHKPGGHRLAGQWLEQAGESDPRVLAEHAVLGQQPERAVHFLTRAAEQHFERHDLPATVRCVDAALALDARGAELTPLRALQATLAFWLGDFTRLFDMGPKVLAELRAGSRPWYSLLSGLYLGHAVNGGQEELSALERELLRTRPEPGARVPSLEARWAVMYMRLYSSGRQEASALLARLVEPDTEAVPEARMEQAFSRCAGGFYSFIFEARPWQAHVWLEQGYRGLFEVGMERLAMGAQVMWAHALEALGDRAGAEALFRDNLAQARRSRIHVSDIYARLSLALLLAGSTDPARREEARALADGQELAGRNILPGLAHLLKAKLAENRGARAEAETRAREACEVLASFVFHQHTARTLLSRVLLAQGRAAEAREVAALGVRRLEQDGSEGSGAVALRMALAEACFAGGDTHAGEAALREALRYLREHARDIPDADARERFLQQVPGNARTLEWARQRWGEAGVL
ncbi:MAG TPA: protein kinase [Archangium sp.]|uniref:serine/threonine-protein kinase n=1 Tax=Archangium sp. TaxID=1872627 RepID=UPI002E342151|nr:protein kinase [Archangium sp.]HEX5754621.1 protein kinase [Archangium sp.]